MSTRTNTVEIPDVSAGHEITSREEWLIARKDLLKREKESGQIFHTYSTFGRGGEEFLGIYRFFDATPKGRNENGPYHSLTDWARLRNMYGRAAMLNRTALPSTGLRVCGASINRLKQQ